LSFVQAQGIYHNATEEDITNRTTQTLASNVRRTRFITANKNHIPVWQSTGAWTIIPGILLTDK